MNKDSISYISFNASDSIAMRDSVQQQHAFSFNPIKGEMADKLEQETLSKIYGDTIENTITPRHYGEPLPFNMEQTDGVFGLLLLCFLFFAHIYNGGVSFLKESISFLFLSSKKDQRTYKQTTAKEIIYGYFLLFQAVILISICAYDVFVEHDSVKDAVLNPLSTIISFIILISLFLGLKNLMYRIIGYIFNQQKAMSVWRRTYILSIEVLGILYFVPTLLLIYSNYYHSLILILILIIFLIVQITLFHQIIGFFVNQKFNFLFLIAYLCTVEILPYIFLSIGLIYLYRIDVFNILWP